MSNGTFSKLKSLSRTAHRDGQRSRRLCYACVARIEVTRLLDLGVCSRPIPVDQQVDESHHPVGFRNIRPESQRMRGRLARGGRHFSVNDEELWAICE